MSINSRMKSVKLQRRIKFDDSRFGSSVKYSWIDAGYVDVAIHEDDRSVIINGIKHIESSCVGLTSANLLSEKNRLVDGDVIYTIQSIVPGRLNKLKLKAVGNDAG